MKLLALWLMGETEFISLKTLKIVFGIRSVDGLAGSKKKLIIITNSIARYNFIIKNISNNDSCSSNKNNNNLCKSATNVMEDTENVKEESKEMDLERERYS